MFSNADRVESCNKIQLEFVILRSHYGRFLHHLSSMVYDALNNIIYTTRSFGSAIGFPQFYTIILLFWKKFSCGFFSTIFFYVIFISFIWKRWIYGEFCAKQYGLIWSQFLISQYAKISYNMVQRFFRFCGATDHEKNGRVEKTFICE